MFVSYVSRRQSPLKVRMDLLIQRQRQRIEIRANELKLDFHFKYVEKEYRLLGSVLK